MCSGQAAINWWLMLSVVNGVVTKAPCLKLMEMTGSTEQALVINTTRSLGVTRLLASCEIEEL